MVRRATLKIPLKNSIICFAYKNDIIIKFTALQAGILIYFFNLYGI